MSDTVDVNILVYASHEASPFRPAAAQLLRRLTTGPGPVYLLWPVISGYLRIATNPSIAQNPLSPAVAQANVDAMLASPHVRTVAESDGFWPIYQRVAEQVRPRGKLVPDAHIVALMHQHGIGTIWTHDRDLRKFDGITVRDPFTAAGPAGRRPKI